MKLKKTSDNTIENILPDLTNITTLYTCVWECVDDGDLSEDVAEEVLVNLGGVKVRAICAPYFDLNKTRITSFPQIEKDVAKLFMRSGVPRVYAKEFAESMMAAVRDFVQMEKRVIARRRRQKKAA